MGLLDDAIREHLELKRRNGADPGEVAREQQEALDPVFPDPSAASAGDAGLEAEPGAGDDGADYSGEPATAQAPYLADPRVESALEDAQATSESSSTGQETVELDMQSVLHGDVEGPTPASPTDPALAGSERDRAPYEPEAESLEWEMPGEESDAHEDSLADGRRASLSSDWDRAEHAGGPGEHADVARELPGQERLSFE